MSEILPNPTRRPSAGQQVNHLPAGTARDTIKRAAEIGQNLNPNLRFEAAALLGLAQLIHDLEQRTEAHASSILRHPRGADAQPKRRLL